MGWIADLLKEIPSAARYKAELESMEKENAELRAENSKLRQEIHQRDDIIQKEKSHNQDLEDIKEKLLIELSPGHEALAAQLAQVLGISEQLATFHLEELAKTRFISAARFYNDRPTIWRLGQDGRGYLVSHGLLK